MGKKEKVCAHFCTDRWYTKYRKTPNTLYSFLLHPIRNEIPSPKRTASSGCPFHIPGNEE